MANTLKFKRGLVGTIPTAALGEPLFTTDTFDLYIGNGTGNTRFQKYIASGTTSQLLRGDGSLLTMPIVLTSPSNGQVLKYNGTSWVNDSDAGITGSGSAGQVAYFTGATTQSGSNNLFWDSANARLGIGTNAPEASLTVVANASAQGIFVRGRASDNRNSIIFQSNDGATSYTSLDARSTVFRINTLTAIPIEFYTNNTHQARITSGGNFIINNASSDNGLRFQVTGDGYFSGSVGIGTNSQTTKLRVEGTVQVTSSGSPTSGAGLEIGYGNFTAGRTAISSYNRDASAFLGADYNSLDYKWYTSGLLRATLDSSGNLGLGVVPSAWNLKGFDISGGALFGDANNVGLSVNAYYNSGWLYKSSATAANYIIVGNEHRWNIAPSGTAGNAITFTQAMTLDASGRLGIGTATPAQLLQVGGISRGQINIVGTIGASPTLTLDHTPTTNGRKYVLYSGGTASGNFDIYDATATTSRLAISSIGNVGIGTTSPSERLHVVGNIFIDSGNDLIFRGTSSYISSPATNTIRIVTNSAEALRVQSTGNVGINTTTDAGYKLDVNGTMRVSGASTIAGTSNGNILLVTGPNTGSNTIHITVPSGTSEGLKLTYNANDGSSDINNVFNAPLYFKTNNTTRLTIASTGAATFSSTIQATGVSKLINTAGNAALVSQVGHIEFYKDATPSYAVSVGMAVPGGSITNDYIISTYSGSWAERFRIATSGAATFSGSVTAGSFIPSSSTIPTNGIYLPSVNTLGFATGTSARMWLTTSALGIGTASPQGLFEVSGAGVSYFTRGTKSIILNPNVVGADTNALIDVTSGMALAFGIGGTEGMRLTSTGLGIGMTPSYKLDVTGQARISDAIAIGTTPDTNLPFKILKNINSTVGIRFENTSTGASSFTGYQFGTDVSGGTAFTNFLYASSGVTETGVYKPNGTALINTGDGGLNFLAVSQPIRFFTSTGTGTLRAAITNDGDFTQYNGTNPSASTTDAFRMYSADITAGNAAPHFRTENGSVIKLYQLTTAIASAARIGGGGTNVTDNDTFGGYKIGQIVEALQKVGILA